MNARAKKAIAVAFRKEAERNQAKIGAKLTPEQDRAVKATVAKMDARLDQLKKERAELDAEIAKTQAEEAKRERTKASMDARMGVGGELHHEREGRTLRLGVPHGWQQ